MKRIFSFVLLAALLLSCCACSLKKTENEYVTTLTGRWDGARDFSEGFAAVKKDKKWGYVNTDGELVIPCVFSDARPFSEGLAAVQSGGSWGYIDHSGKWIISPAYTYTSSFYEGRAVYGTGNRYGYIDPTGAKITEPIFREAFRFREGLACVKTDEHYGYIDLNGHPVTEFEYGIESTLSEGLVPVFYADSTRGINSGYLNAKGELVIDFLWYDARPFSEGLAAVKEEYTGKVGFIDKNNQLVIPLQYDEAESFSHGRALITSERKFTFIDTAGKRITEKLYDKAYSFTEDGLARIGESAAAGYRFGYLNVDGREVIPCSYTNARDFHNGYAAVSNGKLWGLIAADGTEIFGMRYTDVGDMTEEGILRVAYEDTYAFIKLK